MGFLVCTETVRVTGLMSVSRVSDSLTTERHSQKESHPPGKDNSYMPETLISGIEVAQLIIRSLSRKQSDSLEKACTIFVPMLVCLIHRKSNTG